MVFVGAISKYKGIKKSHISYQGGARQYVMARRVNITTILLVFVCFCCIFVGKPLEKFPMVS